MEHIIKEKIAALEKQREEVKKRVVPERYDLLNTAVEIEKLNYAISQLYICLYNHIKE